jgi:hypothetical protein
MNIFSDSLYRQNWSAYLQWGHFFFFFCFCSTVAPCCGWILLISLNNHIVHLRIDILFNDLNFLAFFRFSNFICTVEKSLALVSTGFHIHLGFE